MTFWNGTLASGSNSGTASLWRAKIKETIMAHPNWSFIETVTSGAGTNSTDVYKCSGAGNGLGIDFYVAVMQWSANPFQMCLQIAEGYNPATKKPLRPAMFGQVNATIVMTPDGGIMPANQEVDWWNGSYTNGYAWSSWPNGVGYRPAVNAIDDCGVSVAADGVYIYSKSPDGMYAGVYDSLVPNPSVNDPLPIVVHSFGGTWSNPNSGIGSTTRHPLLGGKTVVNCQPTIIGSGAAAGGNGGANGTPGGTNSRLCNNGYLTTFALGATGNDASDLYAGDGVSPGTYVDRFVFYTLYANGGSSGGRHNIGYARGLYKRLRWCNPLSGTAFLDTVTLDGVEYLYLYNSLFVEKNPA